MAMHEDNESVMHQYLAFKRMIAPIVIRVAFWVGAAICVIAGLVALVTAKNAEQAGAGLAIAVLGPLGVRLYAELLIVIFRVNETLTDIKDVLQKKDTPTL